MASILISEDEKSVGVIIANQLQLGGHQAKFVWAQDPNEMYKNLVDVFDADDKVWDYLVLDIRYNLNKPPDDFGGIRIYNKLVGADYRSRWKHTFVCSRYIEHSFGPGEPSPILLVVGCFLQTAHIPEANAFGKEKNRTEKMLARISEIQSSAIAPVILRPV